MLNVVTMPIRELTALVELGAAATGLPEAIVEKDFWVCYVLDYLFHRSNFANSMIFKGGTSHVGDNLHRPTRPRKARSRRSHAHQPQLTPHPTRDSVGRRMQVQGGQGYGPQAGS